MSEKIFPKKSLGQNFLRNQSLLNKIVEQCDPLGGKNVLEIGAGMGDLTKTILRQNPKKLIAADLDERCVNAVRAKLGERENLTIILGDALKIDEKELFGDEKFSIVSNLPYNISMVLLFKWLNNCLEYIEQAVLLLQKEAADRISSPKGRKEYGKISVLCQYLSDVKKRFDISPGSFFPPPKVMSTVVKLVPKHNIDPLQKKRLFDAASLAFCRRRKTLANNLKDRYGNVANVLAGMGFRPDARAENLSPEDFVRLSEELA
ncbi:MAG: 16S rRNA (adenine(1518)-N(6)/adenine(1519)-N(6))-dimethyltransferase RsmA [Rickettsiales bacterium]|jgi:16S rRNA (adenine1518-N6/adenine1519-N6)-dimethyltransferase|nr:16S rRNA (adenine(1518)-N(6)/adenine(1519)-N(6))-dimethyltransferase RsmA [Rickettsiales bacterium]